jgi:hypothetical protein
LLSKIYALKSDAIIVSKILLLLKLKIIFCLSFDQIIANNLNIELMATFTLHSDGLVECPYDKSHRIAVRNQIKHIIQCEKNSKSKLSICIYNASHRMPRNQFAQHLKTCPDGRQQLTNSNNHSINKIDVNFDNKHNKSSNGLSEALNEGKCLEKSSDEDNWNDDNMPSFSIYDNLTNCDNRSNETTLDMSGNKTNKLTKNQKKRNRRKAALSLAQTRKQSQTISDFD